jgi:hypothetical protein
METMELQTNIIRLVLDINDNELLTYLNNLLQKYKYENESIYKMSDAEKLILQESISAYENGEIIENEDIVKRNKKWQ